MKKLKDPDILKKKPNLVLKPCHYHYVSKKRIHDPEKRGTAQSDNAGWYK